MFSTSHTAVAFGISGPATMDKSPLCSARPSGEAAVIEDDGKVPGIYAVQAALSNVADVTLSQLDRPGACGPFRREGLFGAPEARNPMMPSAATDSIGKPPLRVLLCSPRGFCAGVVRAIDTVERALALHGRPVYVRHEIVHNKYVVESLKNKGAIFVEDLSEVPPRAVTMSAVSSIVSVRPA